MIDPPVYLVMRLPEYPAVGQSDGLSGPVAAGRNRSEKHSAAECSSVCSFPVDGLPCVVSPHSCSPHCFPSSTESPQHVRDLGVTCQSAIVYYLCILPF